MHYYKFNIKDWTRDTAHLSVEEEGVYRRLLDHYYESESPIPVETQSVIRRLRLRGHEEAMSIVLEEFFTLESDGYRHKRCDDEIAKYHAKANANRENGKKGGRPKDAEEPAENPDGFHLQPTDNLNHKPLTNNQDINLPTVDSPQQAACPHQELIEIYHQQMPNNPSVKVWNAKRQAYMRARWNENLKTGRYSNKAEGLDFWTRFFGYCNKSAFLTGNVERKDAPPFIADMEWLISPSNYAKVIEGKYHND